MGFPAAVRSYRPIHRIVGWDRRRSHEKWIDMSAGLASSVFLAGPRRGCHVKSNHRLSFGTCGSHLLGARDGMIPVAGYCSGGVDVIAGLIRSLVRIPFGLSWFRTSFSNVAHQPLSLAGTIGELTRGLGVRGSRRRRVD